MQTILTSIIIMSIIGFVLGILIAICSKIFYVETDKRVKEIYDLLPHFNCGACGTPGCEAMAEELVNGTIVVEKCKPATPDQRLVLNEKMAELGLKNND